MLEEKQQKLARRVNRSSPAEQKKFKRVCLLCENYLERSALLRVVSVEKKLSLDLKNNFPARGAYFGRSPACWEGFAGFRAQRKKKLVKKLKKLGYNFQLSDLESLLNEIKSFQGEPFLQECPCMTS